MTPAPRLVADGIWCVTAGAFPSNSYIVAGAVPGEAILVDCGLDGAAIEQALRNLKLVPTHILCTHGHFDHLGSAATLQANFDIPVYLHSADQRIARRNNFLLMALGLPDRVLSSTITYIENGAQVEEARGARFHHMPGHTSGSCIIQIAEHWFTGDSIYARGLGLSKLPGEDPDQLRRSISAVWNDLPRFTIHPGHGPSALGTAVQTENAALRVFLRLDPNQSERSHAL